MKKFGLLILTLALVSLALILLSLRFPTPFHIAPSTFAPRAKLEKSLPKLKLTYLQTGVITGWEAFLDVGGSLFHQRPMLLGALLVEHPKGTLLIDAGLGKNFPQEWQRAPWSTHLLPTRFQEGLSDYKPGFPQLEKVDAILITHAHWDHLSGINDLPGVPVYLLTQEVEWLNGLKNPYSHHVFPEHLAGLQGRVRPIELKKVPYENFAESLDWFGDGSVVLVPLPGHTPGSLGIFLNLSSEQRYLVVGDALWGTDVEGLPERRTWLAEQFGDEDRTEARRTRELLRELVKHSNEITLVPVHEEKALKKWQPAQDS